jgi:hypothetical protein
MGSVGKERAGSLCETALKNNDNTITRHECRMLSLSASLAKSLLNFAKNFPK